MVKRYVLRRNPITGGHYMAEDDETSGKPLFVKDEDYAALAERCERLQFVCQNVLGGILTGAIVCKPMMRKVNGDYVLEGVQEMLERVLIGDAP